MEHLPLKTNPAVELPHVDKEQHAPTHACKSKVVELMEPRASSETATPRLRRMPREKGIARLLARPLSSPRPKAAVRSTEHRTSAQSLCRRRLREAHPSSSQRVPARPYSCSPISKRNVGFSTQAARVKPLPAACDAFDALRVPAQSSRSKSGGARVRNCHTAPARQGPPRCRLVQLAQPRARKEGPSTEQLQLLEAERKKRDLKELMKRNERACHATVKQPDILETLSASPATVVSGDGIEMQAKPACNRRSSSRLASNEAEKGFKDPSLSVPVCNAHVAKLTATLSDARAELMQHVDFQSRLRTARVAALRRAAGLRLRCAFERNRVTRVQEQCHLLRGESAECCAENSRLVEAAQTVVALQEKNFELHEAAEEDCQAEEIECTKLRHQRDVLQAENQCLEVGMDELREEQKRFMLHNGTVCSQELIWQLESRCQRLQAAEEEAVTSRTDVRSLEVEGLEEKLRELSLETQSCQTEHANTRNLCRSLEERHQESQAIVASLRQSSLLSCSEHAALRDEIWHLECNKCNELHEAEQTAMDLRFSNQTLAATLAHMERELLGKQERCSELENQNQRVHGDLHEAEQSTILMQRRNEHLSAQLCHMRHLLLGADERSSELREERAQEEEQKCNLLKAKERAAALQEENRRLQDKIWRLGEIEQKSEALQAEVHRLHAENRLLSIARQKGKSAFPQGVQESTGSLG